MSDRAWVYGDILRRAVTLNPVQFQFVMYAGPSRGHPAKGGKSFVGIHLNEFPAPAVGKWANAPHVGEVRPTLSRALFELAPEDEQ